MGKTGLVVSAYYRSRSLCYEVILINSWEWKEKKEEASTM